MQLYISKNLVLQLRALRLSIAGCTARSYGTKKTILHNRVLPTVSLLYIAEIP